MCTSQSGIKYTSSSYTSSCERCYRRCRDGTDSPSFAGSRSGAGYCHNWNHQSRAAVHSAVRITVRVRIIWPATTFAADGGTIPFGARFRLKSSFNISGYSPIAQILLTQLKQYGLILADGGSGWAVDAEYAKWPKAVVDAFSEISEAKVISPSNFEAVDESGLEVSASSGLTTANRENVTFTRTSDGATASTEVILTGVAVNFPYDLLQIQGGAPAYQLTALTNLGGVTWSMSPSVGTLEQYRSLHSTWQCRVADNDHCHCHQYRGHGDRGASNIGCISSRSYKDRSRLAAWGSHRHHESD